MNLVVDTHVLLWAAAEPDRLSVSAKGAIADPSVRIHVSLTSLWEIRVEQTIGRLDNRLDLDAIVAGLAASVLDIRRSHIDMVTRLPLHDRDPFDRFPVA
jgi:PIN domain nuclease of toxin-antitoxin system